MPSYIDLLIGIKGSTVKRGTTLPTQTDDVTSGTTSFFIYVFSISCDWSPLWLFALMTESTLNSPFLYYTLRIYILRRGTFSFT